MIFKTCPYCGANLDPEEICDCLKSQIEHSKELFDKYIPETISPIGAGGYDYSKKDNVLIDTGSGNTLKLAPGLEKEEYFGPGNKEHWNL